jgi:hypothetical protein
MELWLSRGKTLQVAIADPNRSVTEPFETLDAYLTCITTESRFDNAQTEKAFEGVYALTK